MALDQIRQRTSRHTSAEGLALAHAHRHQRQTGSKLRIAQRQNAIHLGQHSAQREGQRMDALYLISHRVRGELAYDVALRVLRSGGEELWLIPTSGHRAYPLAYKALAPTVDGMTKCAEWSAVPDHYSGRAVVATLRARVAAAIA